MTTSGGHRRGLPLAVVLGAMLLLGLATLLALNTASAAQELRQRTLTDSNATLSDTEQQLLRDLAQKQSPESLASQAAALGLIPNSNPAFLKVGADGSVTILGVPAPASVPAPAVTPPVAKPPAASTPVASSPVASTPVASTPAAGAPVASTPVLSSPAVSSPVAAPPVAVSTGAAR